MKLHRFQNAHAFYDRAHAYLLQQEVAHNLLLRLSNTLMSDAARFPDPYLAIVEAANTPLAVAIQTPPHAIVLSDVSDKAALDLLAQDLQATQRPLAGVNGPIAASTAFAEAWQQLTGRAYQLHMALCVHQLTQVQALAPTPGYLRTATAADRDLLLDWYSAFTQEAMGEKPLNPERWLTNSLKRGTAHLWQTSEPVAIACGDRASDHAAVVNLVYTPPLFRKQGYATACVAALSQKLIDQGFRACALFTDLANPTSNKIYRAIGYVPVSAWHHYRFESP